MTAGQGDKDKAAATGFIAVMTLALGAVGLVLAALAVGTERVWANVRGESPSRAATKRDALSDARAWLGQDAAHRAGYRKARREWWAAGADPAMKPPQPSMVQRAGAWFRRAAAKDRVLSEEFVTGWRDGWQAAKQVRKDGGGFGDIVKARPLRPAESVADDTADPTPDLWDTPPSVAGSEREWLSDRPLWHAEPEDDPLGADLDAPDADDQSPSDEEDPTIPTPATDGGTPMAEPTSDSNAAVLAAKLAAVAQTTQQVSDQTDQLAGLNQTLRAQVADAAEFAEQTGQTSATRQALDSANATAAQVSEATGRVSEATDRTVEVTVAAREGLRTVEHAEDALRQAGADGRAVAPATSGAA